MKRYQPAASLTTDGAMMIPTVAGDYILHSDHRTALEAANQKLAVAVKELERLCWCKYLSGSDICPLCEALSKIKEGA